MEVPPISTFHYLLNKPRDEVQSTVVDSTHSSSTSERSLDGFDWINLRSSYSHPQPVPYIAATQQNNGTTAGLVKSNTSDFLQAPPSELYLNHGSVVSPPESQQHASLVRTHTVPLVSAYHGPVSCPPLNERNEWDSHHGEQCFQAANYNGVPSQTSNGTPSYVLQELPKVSGPTYLFEYHGSPVIGPRSETSSSSVSSEGGHTISTNGRASDEEFRPSPPDSGPAKFRVQKSSTRSGKSRRRPPTQAQRRAANVRERKRMNNLNDAFDVLRKLIPTFAYEKHLSRIETLRLAMDYIGFMTDLLDVPVDAALQKYANAESEMKEKWSARV